MTGTAKSPKKRSTGAKTGKSPARRKASNPKTPKSPTTKKKVPAKSPKAVAPPKSPARGKSPGRVKAPLKSPGRKLPLKSPGRKVPLKSPGRNKVPPKSPARGKSPGRQRAEKVEKARTPSKRKRDEDKDVQGSAKKRKTQVGEDGCSGFSDKMKIHAEKNAEKKRLEILQLREGCTDKDDKPLWPLKQLKYKAWHDEAFDYVRLTLNSRGWKDLGNMCDLSEIEVAAPGEGRPWNDERGITQLMQDIIDGKAKEKLPKYCLWWVHEDDARRLLKLPTGKGHVITSFMGTNAAVTKVATTQQNNDEHFYPKAFILPKQSAEMKEYIKDQKKSYWIAKPRNDYAGRGVVVYNADSDEFRKVINDDKRPEFVVQTYLAKPLLLGGYKFHFRMYTVLCGVLDNFEAYLYRDGHGLFSTEKYSIADDTLGDKFNEFIHLTNWSINFVKGNKHLKENKDVIGVGCEWSVGNVLKFIKKARPEFDIAKFWKDMTEVCAVTMYKLAQWKRVKHFKKENESHLRFENFGLDVLMDENFKIWLMEANTEVGLNAIMEDFPDENCTAPSWKKRQGNEIYCTKNGCVKCRGGKNLRFRQNNKVLSDVIHASLDLMQLDVPKSRRINKTLIPLHPFIEEREGKVAGAPKKAASGLTVDPKAAPSKAAPKSGSRAKTPSKKPRTPKKIKSAAKPKVAAMDVDEPEAKAN